MDGILKGAGLERPRGLDEGDHFVHPGFQFLRHVYQSLQARKKNLTPSDTRVLFVRHLNISSPLFVRSARFPSSSRNFDALQDVSSSTICETFDEKFSDDSGNV
jgi:hypothetical protein